MGEIPAPHTPCPPYLFELNQISGGPNSNVNFAGRQINLFLPALCPAAGGLCRLAHDRATDL